MNSNFFAIIPTSKARDQRRLLCLSILKYSSYKYISCVGARVCLCVVVVCYRQINLSAQHPFLACNQPTSHTGSSSPFFLSIHHTSSSAIAETSKSPFCLIAHHAAASTNHRQFNDCGAYAVAMTLQGKRKKFLAR